MPTQTVREMIIAGYRPAHVSQSSEPQIHALA